MQQYHMIASILLALKSCARLNNGVEITPDSALKSTVTYKKDDPTRCQIHVGAWV